jgi:hypothetical protein
LSDSRQEAASDARRGGHGDLGRDRVGTATGSPVVSEAPAGLHRRVREVREHAVDAEPEELPVLAQRVAAVVGGEAAPLVAERPGVHEQTAAVRAPDQRRARQQPAIGLVDQVAASSRERLECEPR